MRRGETEREREGKRQGDGYVIGRDIERGKRGEEMMTGADTETHTHMCVCSF